LQEQEARYRSYVGALAHLLWVTDAGGQVTGDLPGLSAFTGLTAEQLRGWGWLQAVHPDDRARVEGAWRRAVADRSLFETALRLRACGGEYRHFLLPPPPLPPANPPLPPPPSPAPHPP